MALATRTIESYSNCFEQIDKACHAIQQGNATKAVGILCSVRDDAKMLYKQSKIHYEGLRRLEGKQNFELERLMAKINALYQKEQECLQQERELGIQKEVLEKSKESEEESYDKAKRRYRDARAERDKAQEKLDKLHKWFWVPGYGAYLAIEELVENNEKKSRDASRDMEYYRKRSRDAQREIDRLSTAKTKVKRKIRKSREKQSELKQKRDEVHEQLGVTKKASVYLLEASNFWDEISSLTDNASLKTDRMEKILRSAANLKKNQEKVLRSKGTKTFVGSFKDCWLEIEDMIRSNDLVVSEDSLAEFGLKRQRSWMEFGWFGHNLPFKKHFQN